MKWKQICLILSILFCILFIVNSLSTETKGKQIIPTSKHPLKIEQQKIKIE
jgi:hypothetical protein